MALNYELKQVIIPSSRIVYEEVSIFRSASKSYRHYTTRQHVSQKSLRQASTHNYHFGNLNQKIFGVKLYLRDLNFEIMKKAARTLNYVNISKAMKQEPLSTATGSCTPSHNAKEEVEKEVEKEVSQSKQSIPTEQTNETKQEVPLITRLHQLQQPLYSLYVDKPLVREQHDFHQAMSSKFESISSFHTGFHPRLKEKLGGTSPPQPENDTSHTPNSSVTDLTTSSQDDSPQQSSTISTFFKATLGAAGSALQSAPGMLTARKEGTGATSLKRLKDKNSTSVIKTHNESDNKQDVSSKKQLELRTIGLAQGLLKAKSDTSRSLRLEGLCSHLVKHPEFRSVALRENIVSVINQMKEKLDPMIACQAREALALLGVADPPKGQGIRILSLDGGGTRGLKMIQTLKCLEQACGKPLHEVFDYMCGVSTGGLIAILLSVFRIPLDDCEEIYKYFSSEMFSQNRLIGTSKLVMSHAYYDSELWESILKEHIGSLTFLETTHDPRCPKVSVVSNLMNLETTENFVFRNYMLPVGTQSHFHGAIKYSLWQAIRASSAAPGYYAEFILDEYVHLDGGVMTNNPTAVALHEAKHLWPKEKIQCVVSMGTGRYKGAPKTDKPAALSLRDKLNKIVQSATNTEDVHLIVQDLLPPATYFRFNPYMSEDFLLDEVNPEKWEKMIANTQLYCRKNEHKFHKAAATLLAKRGMQQRVQDWASQQIQNIKL